MCSKLAFHSRGSFNRAKANVHYNMTAWILAGNGNHLSIAAGLDKTTYAWRQVISCVTMAGACRRVLSQMPDWHRVS